MKSTCTCDEINARHCQYHQEIADLRAENDKLTKAVEVMRYALQTSSGFIHALAEVEKILGEK